ncbi:MAG: hypothetical protein KKC68_03850 [Candidatus Thermoplasmatota archaeon]|nr:hypothetical protein [Candidatus Thermoplasmatota archaeon]MBU1940884.1 hypothetical protein [Candidatus Thermoplasmatota archaeon]
MEKTGLSIGIIGGIGLGLMVGREFSDRYITILGAILVIISIVSIGLLSYNRTFALLDRKAYGVYTSF